MADSATEQEVNFDDILRRRMASSEEYVLIVTYRAVNHDEATDVAEMLSDRLHGLEAIQKAQYGPENCVVAVSDDMKNVDLP